MRCTSECRGTLDLFSNLYLVSAKVVKIEVKLSALRSQLLQVGSSVSPMVVYMYVSGMRPTLHS